MFAAAGRLLLLVGTATALQPCPPTLWATADALTAPCSHRPESFLKVVERPVDCPDEAAWLQRHSEGLVRSLGICGALHFRGFELPKSKAGFRQFVEALPLEPCQDSLASIGVRSLLSASDGVYAAVDAESLASTFIGLHNDATFKLAAPFAAFVCFQQAITGGAFLLADGRAVLRALDPSVVATLQARGLRVRVAALTTSFLAATGPLRPVLAACIAAAVGLGLKVAVPLGLELAWSEACQTLQVLEPLKRPVTRHPITGHPTWFSGLHSQSAHLQRKRAAATGGDVFEGVAATEVFYGDSGDVLEPVSSEALDHVDAVVERLTVRVRMQPGDVVLLDSYQVLHGRDTFQGPRQHGVLWLTSSDYAQ